MEKNKLFVKGLPFTTTKDALITIFSEVKLVTFPSAQYRS